MTANIVVPEMGESIVDARVAKWFKQEGDRVLVGEPLVELETDKVDIEVSAPQSGVLAKIQAGQGADVRIGDVLGNIEGSENVRGSENAESSENVRGSENTGGSENVRGSANTRGSVNTGGSENVRGSENTRGSVNTGGSENVRGSENTRGSVNTGGSESVRRSENARTPESVRRGVTPPATPSARKAARDHQVDLASVATSGARITRDDVKAAVSQSSSSPTHQPTRAPAAAAPAAPAASAAPAEPETAPRAPETRERMSRRRATIARRLVEVQSTAAMLTTFNEIDMTAVQALRARQKESFAKKYGIGLGLSSFFVKAAVAALRDFPRLNAEIQGDEIVLKHYYDIGMAVGAPEGLVVPVLRDADRQSFAAIETAVRAFAGKANDGTLSIDDLRGGTFTITNGGVFGSLMSTPILNPPQVGILGLHAIKERPVGVNGQIVLRPMMYVALTYDHRIVDGAEAVRFLVRIKELIEDPGVLLVEL